MKTKQLLGILLLALVGLNTTAQTTFQKIYNWAGVVAEDAKSVQQTTDGGYMITGFIYPPSGGDAQLYFIKTDMFGDTAWFKHYDGIGSGTGGNSVQQTSDGGYIATGIYQGGGVYLVKTNNSGDSLWTKKFAVGAIGTAGNSVQQTNDGGYIIAGTLSTGADDNIYLLKTNSIGDTLWTKTFSGNGVDFGYSVQQTTDGGYIIAGETWSFGAGSIDAYLIKTNSNGDTLWTKTFGTANGDGAREVRQTTDGGYIICGLSNGDIKLIKTNASGNLVWQQNFGGINLDIGNSVKQTNDGGYIITGYIQRFDTGIGIWINEAHLIKTNSVGTQLWDRNYGTVGTEGFSVQQTTDGGYIATGASSRIFLLKTDSLGNVAPTGISTNFIQGNEILIFPNPSNGVFELKSEMENEKSEIKIYNALGEIIYQSEIKNDKTEIDLSSQPKGIYFYQITSPFPSGVGRGEAISSGKIIVQ